MRTENKEFARLQNRLRELRFIQGDSKKKQLEKMNEEDIKYLAENCVGKEDDPDYNPKDLHIFLTNAKVDEHNKKVLDLMSREGNATVEIICRDSIQQLMLMNQLKLIFFHIHQILQ